MRTIVWYRHKDLRISDHEPLREAAASGEALPVVVIENGSFSRKAAVCRPLPVAFHLESLLSLRANLRAKGSDLLVVEGQAKQRIPQLVGRLHADRVVAHRLIEPAAVAEVKRIKKQIGGKLELYEGETLHPPGTLRTRSGAPYSVFTHFANAFADAQSIGPPVVAPRSLPAASFGPVASTELPTPEELGIERRNKDAHGGERAAQERLRIFIRNAASRYDELRDRMDLEGTSRLSADLKFGTLSPRQIHHQVRKTVASGKARDAFLRQLVWREFAYSTLFDRPELVRQPFRQEFASFPWRDDVALWKAWTEGNTGYPIVDAAARQLLCEGFVHNRARMIAASFLAKHLMIHYRRGEAHYLKYLVDGDLAQNNMGWQWSAGCGCDAQPYFRVFNPMLQGKRFDPNGNYVRRWVPELAKLPNTRIHAPWEASVSQLEAAGVELGRDYPRPIVDHKAARERFLQLASGFLKAA